MKTKNILLITLLIFFITLEVLIALDYVARDRSFSERRASVVTAMVQLQDELGYVGLIHNFKNYLVRPNEPIYRERVLLNYESSLKYINQIEREGSDILGELRMPRTRDMIEAYKERLYVIQKLVRQHKSITEIDAQVRFDDNPSHEEIERTLSMLMTQMEQQRNKILFRSLLSGFVILISVIITLSLLMRFLLNEQRKVIIQTQQVNQEMEKNKVELLRSQQTMLNIIEDINHEKKRVSELNARLEQKNSEMEQFIYTVSHDLKSPLVTISGFSKQLLNELKDQISDRQAHRLSRINENTKQMETLLKDLLELSRVVQQDISKKIIHTDQLVSEQCRGLSVLLEKTNAKIIIHSPLFPIFANERLISQSINNLISNAIHYRDPNRNLVIDISTRETETHTTLIIQDNGVGIDPKYHDLIFRIFERLSDKEGTGVGLTIVKTVMDKHQGEVAVYSNEGKGARFELKFPKQ